MLVWYPTKGAVLFGMLTWFGFSDDTIEQALQAITELSFVNTSGAV